MHFFYTPDISSNSYRLSEEESKHCVKVLRLTSGDRVILFDGKGNRYSAVVDRVHPKKCSVIVTDVEKDPEPRYKLTVAIAPTKSNDRFEWFLEKATEIGISTIVPIICQNSERKVIKPVRLQKILISAMKQSKNSYLPDLQPITSFNDFVKNYDREHKYIAHCYEAPKAMLNECYSAGNDLCICIGPEGDFSPEEVELAHENGFINLNLGDSRLRTETAGIVACTTAAFLNKL